jgi:toxin-antitoxin system PIN domain toxin
MAAFLLDVNVLIALLWPAHEAHPQTQKWFHRNWREGWATCPFTQAAFARIVSNPRFSRDALSPRDALKLLDANLRHPGHHFWTDGLPLAEAVGPFAAKLTGHQQITDAYLLGMALHKKGRLVTLDRSVLALLPESEQAREAVALI